MLVVACGGNRTGSTWVYRIAGEVLKRAGHTVRMVGADPATVPHEGLTVVCKSHTWLPLFDTDVRGLYTYRDPLDVLASWRTFGKELTDTLLRQTARFQVRTREMLLCPTVLCVRYEDAYATPIHTVKRVAEFLGCPVDFPVACQVEATVGVDAARRAAAKIEEGAADPVTQLRRNHVSHRMGKPGAGQSLPAEIVERFNALLEDADGLLA